MLIWVSPGLLCCTIPLYSLHIVPAAQGGTDECIVLTVFVILLLVIIEMLLYVEILYSI